METRTFLMTSSYYPPYHFGGDAVHVKYLSEGLVNLGHEVHVMFSIDGFKYKKPDFNGSLKNKEELNGVNLYPLQSPLGKPDLYFTYLTGGSSYVERRFSGILKEIKPDVVHHHNIFFLGYNILKKYGKYTNLYTAHDYWLICQRFDLMKYGKIKCEHKNCFYCTLLSRRLPQVWRNSKSFTDALGDIDTVIAPSNFMKAKLLESLPVKANVVNIPNFVPRLHKDIKDSNYSNYFLYVGALEKHKGICNLVKMFNEPGMEMDAKLIIVGAGSLKKRIDEYITKNKLENKIFVLGWVSNDMLWSLYKDALALVIPSIWPENNPIAALEAISAGLPVIGTNMGGLGEIIEKIDRNLIIKDDGLKGVVANFKKPYFKNKIKQVYDQFYSFEGFLRDYMKLMGEVQI